MTVVNETILPDASPLAELGAKFNEVRTKRLDIDKVVKELKEQELELSKQLLMSMEASKMPEFRIANGPKIVTRVSGHFELADDELFYRAILGRAIQCLKDGTPIATAFTFLNRAINKAGLQSYLDDNEQLDMANIGVRYVEDVKLGINK